jgi:hypothetical protein
VPLNTGFLDNDPLFLVATVILVRRERGCSSHVDSFFQVTSKGSTGIEALQVFQRSVF